MTETNLFDAVRRIGPNLSRAEQQVADLVQPDRFIRLPLSDAAQLASVSEPTVVRFCRSLERAGYPDFKLKLAQSLASNRPYLHQEIAPGDTRTRSQITSRRTALRRSAKLASR